MNRNSRINQTFAKQHAKARDSYKKRMASFYQNQETLEQERLARLAAYKGEIPTPKVVEKETNSFSAIGFSEAVKLVIEPTSRERRLGRIGSF